MSSLLRVTCPEEMPNNIDGATGDVWINLDSVKCFVAVKNAPGLHLLHSHRLDIVFNDKSVLNAVPNEQTAKVLEAFDEATRHSATIRRPDIFLGDPPAMNLDEYGRIGNLGGRDEQPNGKTDNGGSEAGESGREDVPERTEGSEAPVEPNAGNRTSEAAPWLGG